LINAAMNSISTKTPKERCRSQQGEVVVLCGGEGGVWCAWHLLRAEENPEAEALEKEHTLAIRDLARGDGNVTESGQLFGLFFW